MNILKIQDEIMKRREDNDTTRCLYCVNDEYVYYSPDGFVMYRIPESRFYLSIDKVFKDINPFKVESIWKPEEAKRAIKTGDIKIQTQGKKQFRFVKIKSESDFAWIDERLLKIFDSDCDFLLTNSVSSVYILENDCIAGIVMPTKIKE